MHESMMTKVAAWMLLVAGAVAVAGCDQGETNDARPATTAPAATQAAQGAAAEPATQETHAPQLQPATQSAAPVEPAAPDAASQADPSQAPNLAPIAIALPRPNFVGTPKEIPAGIRLKQAPDRRPPFYAPRDSQVVSLNKPVTSSDSDPIIGTFDLITDGDKEAVDGAYIELSRGPQWVQIDLGQRHRLDAVVIWHFHMNARVYRDVIVAVSNDPDFIEYQVLFNNDFDSSAGLGVGQDLEYFDTHEGELIDTKGVEARYVRLYSNGSTADEQNHYTEVEVWGAPVE